MQVNSAINSGLEGFQKAKSRMNEAAQSIASQNVTDASKEGINNKDLTNSLIDLKTAEIDAKANIKVVQAASDVLGTILDVTA